MDTIMRASNYLVTLLNSTDLMLAVWICLLRRWVFGDVAYI